MYQNNAVFYFSDEGFLFENLYDRAMLPAHSSSLQLAKPNINSLQYVKPNIHSAQYAKPNIHWGKSNGSSVQDAKPNISCAKDAKPNIHCGPDAKPNISCVSDAKTNISCEQDAKSNASSVLGGRRSSPSENGWENKFISTATDISASAAASETSSCGALELHSESFQADLGKQSFIKKMKTEIQTSICVEERNFVAGNYVWLLFGFWRHVQENGVRVIGGRNPYLIMVLE